LQVFVRQGLTETDHCDSYQNMATHGRCGIEDEYRGKERSGQCDQSLPCFDRTRYLDNKHGLDGRSITVVVFIRSMSKLFCPFRSVKHISRLDRLLLSLSSSHGFSCITLLLEPSPSWVLVFEQSVQGMKSMPAPFRRRICILDNTSAIELVSYRRMAPSSVRDVCRRRSSYYPCDLRNGSRVLRT